MRPALLAELRRCRGRTARPGRNVPPRWEPRVLRQISTTVVLGCVLSMPAAAQTPSDAAIAAIREQGIERSRVLELAQVLMDSIGPRLTGSPGSTAASD